MYLHSVDLCIVLFCMRVLKPKNFGQENVLVEYVKESDIKGKIYHQYYKKIFLFSNVFIKQ